MSASLTELATTRLSLVAVTVLYLTALYTPLAVANEVSLSCNDSQFVDRSSNSCVQCTNCSINGLTEHSPCTNESDAVCHEACPSGAFFNGTDCQVCTRCEDPRLITSNCTATRDTVCHDCGDRFFFNRQLGRCTVNCLKCASGECNGVDHCQCGRCESGQLCQHIEPNCGTMDPSSEVMTASTLPSDSSETSSFSPITSALVAVGAVLGIIIFSVLFVLLGVFTSCRRGNQTGDSANGSSDSQPTRTSSLASLYASNHAPSSLSDYRTNTSTDIFNNSLYSRDSPRMGRPLSASSYNRDKIWTPV